MADKKPTKDELKNINKIPKYVKVCGGIKMPKPLPSPKKKVN